MTVREIAEKLQFKLLAGEGGIDNVVTSVYTCDLLSWVMVNAKENQIWFTVIGNTNSIAVATLKGVSCIVLTENASLDEDAKARAEQMNIPVFVTEKDSASALILTDKLLQ